MKEEDKLIQETKLICDDEPGKYIFVRGAFEKSIKEHISRNYRQARLKDNHGVSYGVLM